VIGELGRYGRCSPACLAGSGAGLSVAIDPRKDAVQSGVALVMRGLLQTMYVYCEGPPSTLQVEAAFCVAMAATSGAVLWAMSEVKAGRPIKCGLISQVERVLNGCPLSGVIRRTYAL
jgi:hypothetical protein